MATTRYSVEFVTDNSPLATGDKRLTLQNLKNIIRAILGGSIRNSSTVRLRTGTARATGTLTLATSSGTVGGVINGVTITVTWATSDTLSAAAVAAAINASTDALVVNLVTATSALGVVTITSVSGGKHTNAFTLAASGTNVTASGARLTGGDETHTLFTF